jgi:hypothetical protein
MIINQATTEIVNPNNTAKPALKLILFLKKVESPLVALSSATDRLRSLRIMTYQITTNTVGKMNNIFEFKKPDLPTNTLS